MDSDTCDVTDAAQIKSCVQKYLPDIIIHCAAYTAVDRAESETELCRRINVSGTRILADLCCACDIPLMLMSTDYVFGDNGDMPHSTDDVRNALNQYGQSKIDAEDIVMTLEKHYIVRTSWLFGDGKNFVKTIYGLSQKKAVIDVVADQIGSPTFAEDIAFAIHDLIRKAPYGVYHLTNEGYCSWADLAEKVIVLTGSDARINRVKTSEYISAARRPLNSRLSKSLLDKNSIARLPDWEDALQRYISLWEL